MNEYIMLAIAAVIAAAVGLGLALATLVIIRWLRNFWKCRTLR